MLDKDLIKEKIKKILVYLEELKPILAKSYKEYIKDYMNFRTAERNIQLIVDAAVDINNHIILEKGKEPPIDYYDSFIKMEEIEIISSDLSKKLASSTGLRNKLVHEYEKINDHLLYLEAKKNLKNYLDYAKAVMRYLKNR